jgi:hypothetical protein
MSHQHRGKHVPKGGSNRTFRGVRSTVMDVAVGPAVIGRLIHLQTSNKTERERARKSEKERGGHAKKHAPHVELRGVVAGISPAPAERREAAVGCLLHHALTFTAAPGRAVDIASRIGSIEFHGLDAEATGVGLDVELRAAVSHQPFYTAHQPTTIGKRTLQLKGERGQGDATTEPKSHLCQPGFP